MIRGFVDPEIRGFGGKNTTSKLVIPGINVASKVSLFCWALEGTSAFYTPIEP